MESINENKIRRKYVFCILTYRNTGDLEPCLMSINKNVEDCGIIIVNSHYNDESERIIENLAKKYNAFFIDVPNKGYGYGNNEGIAFAKEKFAFQYIIISNPDILIKKFEEDVFIKYPGAVVAPQIITIKGKAQNPYWFRYNRFAEYLVYKGYKNDNVLLLFMGFGITKIERELALFGISVLKKECSFVAGAHGSFSIFPVDVIDKIQPLYDPEMFLFAEESYLARLFKNYNIRVVYTTDISILHKEDGSMSVSNINQNKYAKESVIYYYEKLKK